MAKSIFSAPHFHNEEAALEYIEARLWPNGPVCPKCGATAEHIGALKGETTRMGLRKCYTCEAQFTVRVGTIFESSHLALNLWLQAIHLMCASKNGISTRELQRLFKCSMKTAWHLTHRIREAMKDGGLEPLGGAGKVIEADSTYVGGKEYNKHVSKRNPKNIGGMGKQIVHAIVERDGRVRAHHIPRISRETLRPILDKHADKASRFMTDAAGEYRLLGREFADFQTVNHQIDEYVRGDAHSNTVEGYFSVLKRGLTGTYHAVSEAHLHRYLAEFSFRYSNREKLGIDDVSRAEIALQGVKGKRLTYRTTRRERREAAS
jgi:transposase-like protein